MRTLLDPSFLRQLENLRLYSRISLTHTLGERSNQRRRGGSMEFLEHRQYQPGDDFRHIDWSVYRRLGRLAVKEYTSEEELPTLILVDTSASMGVGSPSKLDLATRLAAGLAVLALSGHERCGLVLASSDQWQHIPLDKGASQISHTMSALAQVEASGETNLGEMVSRVFAESTQARLVLIISDFLTPHPETALAPLMMGREAHLFGVLSPQEISPPYRGPLLLEDAETSQKLELDATAVGEYHRLLRAHQDRLRALADRLGGSYTLLSSDTILQEIFFSQLMKGGLIR